ncbi:MAG TPA: GNAT family N-acetyltransferase [Solirubrobacterales bacterium]|nr:GNAT family N-acetyltransferase [Solirubrobacterales bacterium]
MSEPVATKVEVRPATPADVPAAARAVGELLDELGGRRPSAEELEAEARALVGDPGVGALLVATAGEELVGVLAASYGRAMHVPGRYLVIQDLWVDPAWRSRTIGADLLAAVDAVAREQGLARIEVGLPQESFAQIRATEAFYLGNGFASLGTRMRRLLT